MARSPRGASQPPAAWARVSPTQGWSDPQQAQVQGAGQAGDEVTAGRLAGAATQGGAWGHDPGSRQPRREGAGVGETHTAAQREGRKQTQETSRLSVARAADSQGPRPRQQAASRPCSAFVLRGPGAGGGLSWTGVGGWAGGAEGPEHFGEHGPSQVP